MANILVVDDEQGFRQILRVLLTKAGYRTRIVDSAEGALNALLEEYPDAIILDDQMPGMSGGELARNLKASAHTAHIPIIFYSASTRAEDSTYTRAIGVDAVVKKPSMPADLLGAVERCLSAQAGV